MYEYSEYLARPDSQSGEMTTMMDVRNHRTVRLASVGGTLVAAAALVAACSSSAKSSTSSNPAGNGGSASPAGGAAVSVEAHSGPMGTYLTDSSGKSLYMFASDSATKSSCSGACATYWPPLTTSGTPHAMGGVTSGMLTTITRSDGSKQVVYHGHPLYYFKLDSAAGDTKGQGSSNFGAKWWLLAPSGQPITSSGGASSSAKSPTSSSSSKSGGGGGWS